MSYTCLPKSLLEDEAFKHIGSTDRLVYLVICLSPYNNISGCVSCYADDLARYTDLSVCRVRMALRKLNKIGLIRYKNGWAVVPALLSVIRGQKQIENARKFIAGRIPPAIRKMWEDVIAEYAQQDDDKECITANNRYIVEFKKYA